MKTNALIDMLTTDEGFKAFLAVFIVAAGLVTLVLICKVVRLIGMM